MEGGSEAPRENNWTRGDGGMTIRACVFIEDGDMTVRRMLQGPSPRSDPAEITSLCCHIRSQWEI